MKGLWAQLTKERQLPGPLRYVDVFKLLRLITLKRALVTLGLLVVLHTAANIGAYFYLQAELRKTAASGIEMDVDKYAPPFAIDNAAPLYRAAGALLGYLGEDEWEKEYELWRYIYTIDKRWPEQGPPDPGVQDKMSQFLQLDRVALALDLIERGNRMPECNWELRYSDTYDMLLPHLMDSREAARTLLVRARLRYLTGDRKGAAADVEAVLSLAQRLEPDRMVVSELVQYGLASLCTTGVREMSSAKPMNRETALQLGQVLVQFEGLIGMTEALHCDTAMQFATSERLRGNPDLAREFLEFGPHGKGLPYYVTYPFRPLYRADQARLLRYMRELVELSRQRYRRAKDRLNAMEEELSKCSRHSLSRLLLSGLTRAQATVDEARARVRTARVGLALEAWRDEAGSYPESLAPLTRYFTEIPVDPFTGQSFIYRLTDDELLVYSVGENGIDDQGLTEEDGKRLQRRTDDIAWRIRR